MLWVESTAITAWYQAVTSLKYAVVYKDPVPFSRFYCPELFKYEKEK